MCIVPNWDGFFLGYPLSIEMVYCLFPLSHSEMIFGVRILTNSLQLDWCIYSHTLKSHFMVPNMQYWNHHTSRLFYPPPPTTPTHTSPYRNRPCAVIIESGPLRILSSGISGYLRQSLNPSNIVCREPSRSYLLRQGMLWSVCHFGDFSPEVHCWCEGKDGRSFLIRGIPLR